MHDEILHLPEWTRTALGTPIELFRKGHSGAGLVIFIGGVHGDEPEGVRLAQDLLTWVRAAEACGERLRPWIIVPDINPDGSSKQQRTNGRGVDLNRNFPSDDWTPDAKSPRYNPGAAPLSEPEVKALCELLNKEKPSLIVHFHSWEPQVVYTGANGKAAAEILASSSGYEAKEDIGYPTPGSLGQYGAYTLKTPVICIEAQEKSDLNSVWPLFGPGLQRLLQGNA